MMTGYVPVPQNHCSGITCCSVLKSSFSSSTSFSSPCSHRAACSALHGLTTRGLSRKMRYKQYLAENECSECSADLIVNACHFQCVFCLTMSPKTGALPEGRRRTFFPSVLEELQTRCRDTTVSGSLLAAWKKKDK